jgi:streptomycin 6-kinase
VSTSILTDVPDALIASQLRHRGAGGRAWIASLPRLIANILDLWMLRPGGPARHGMASLVLPVVCADGMAAALKLQPLDDENAGEPIGLRAWDGDGAVRLLDHDPATGAMLLERLDATRPLSAVAETPALQILAELLARLVAVPAPRPAAPGRHRRRHA